MNKLIIVVGPSGAGKSSFVDKIVEEMAVLKDIITCTTRPMRKGESQGHPYHFMNREEFEAKIEQGHFLEYARVHDQLYGTPKDQIEDSWKAGKVLIMDVDVQGAKTFIEKYPAETLTIFILPPSIDELRQRVIQRDGDTVRDLDLRMSNAEKEMAMAREFHHVLVNDDFDQAYGQFKKIVENIVNKH